jgi:hypothetical protein
LIKENKLDNVNKYILSENEYALLDNSISDDDIESLIEKYAELFSYTENHVI